LPRKCQEQADQPWLSRWFTEWLQPPAKSTRLPEQNENYRGKNKYEEQEKREWKYVKGLKQNAP
jgi:hypothetical protein